MSDITITVQDEENISITVQPTANLSGANTDELTEGSTNLYHTSERVDDRVNALLQAGSNITLTYDDTANTLTISSQDTEDNLSNNTTSDLAEGSNLYFTEARVDTALTTVGGHILPATDDTHDLGSPTKQWRELYLGPQSLYIDGVQLISRTADVYDFTTDSGQQIRIQPNNHLTLESISGDIFYRSSGSHTFSTGNVAVSAGNVAVTGNITSTGFIETGGTGLKTGLITGTNEITLTPNATSFVHANTGNVYVGSFSQAVHITGTEVKGVGTNPNITANNLTVGGTVSGIDTDDVGEGSNLYYTDERVDDRVSNLLQAGSNITLSYDDANGTLTISSTDTEDNLSNNTTDDLAEGSSNLYFTNARAQAVSINSLSEDTAPSLSSNLNLNSNNITGSGNIDITGALTLSGDVTGDSGDLNIVNTADGSAINLKIDDTSSTRRTAMVVKQYDYLADNAVGSPLAPPPFSTGGSTATTQYDSYVVVDGGGIKIGDSGEFSSTGGTPNSNAGDFHLNGVLVNPTGNTWPTINLVSTGKSAGMNPVYDFYGTSFGGTFEEYPNAAFLFNAANGLVSSPTALGANKRIGQIAWQAHDSVKYGGASSVASATITVESVEQAATNNARGAKMIFDFTKKNGASTDGDSPSDRKDTLTMDSDTFTVGASSYPVITTFNGNTTFEDDVNVNGTLNANGDLTVDGNTTLGNGSSDNIIPNGRFTDHLITDNISNLGSSNDRWGFTYTEDLDVLIDADVGRDLTVTRNLQVDGSEIDFTNLPTSDPNVAGRLWRSGNDVKISTG